MIRHQLHILSLTYYRKENWVKQEVNGSLYILYLVPNKKPFVLNFKDLKKKSSNNYYSMYNFLELLVNRQ